MKPVRISGFVKSMLAAAAVLTVCTAQADSTVKLLAPTSVLSGAVFYVEVRGADFVPIVGGGLDLSFSAGMLELLSVQIDPSWNFFSDPGAIDNSLGTLSGMLFNIWGQKSGDFAIATLQFQAKTPGAASIDLATSEDWPFATFDNPHVPAVSLMGAGVQITSAVPEPAAWLLMLGGLGLLGRRLGRRPA